MLLKPSNIVIKDLLHKITIRDYGFYTKSGDLSSLKKYGINQENISELNINIEEGLSGISTIINEGFDNINYYYKLLKLESIFDALMFLIPNEERQEKLCNLLGKEPPVKKSEYYKKKIYENNQIKIETINDLIKIKKEVERLKDKYNERKLDNKSNTVSFMDVVLSIMMLTGYNGGKIDYDLVLSDLFNLKKMIPTKQNG